MRHLGSHKEHCGRIGAGRHASAAADAGGGHKGLFGILLGDGGGIGLGRAARIGRDIAASLNQFIQSAAVDRQILDHREGARPPRFDHHRVAVS